MGSPGLQPRPAEQSVGGREARRCPSVSWGLAPGSFVSSSLRPRTGCRPGPCGAESRVICPLSCFPISPTWTLETPALPVPVSRGRQHGFPGSSQSSVTLRLEDLHCVLTFLPSQLLFTLTLTLLVLLTWPGPTQPGLSSAGRCDSLPGLPLP